MTDPQQPARPTITPVVAWFSEHGVKLLAVLIVVEVLFHAYAISNRTMP
jgi:hypothetical protein